MNDLPWMSKDEVDLLLSVISYKTVFEYGSGSSTLWLSKNAKSVVSVEHDLDWFMFVQSNISSCSNAKVNHVPPSTAWNPKSDLDGTLLEFYDYVHFPLSCKDQYEVFLVDGRARIACCDLISKNFPSALIAFHDFNNRLWDGIHDYGKVLDTYKIVEKSSTLAILELRHSV